MDHPDGNLRWAHITELHAQLVMALRHYRPAAVITFGEDGLYWHIDHIGVHERTTTAVALMGASAPPLYYVTMPVGVMREIVNAAGARFLEFVARCVWRRGAAAHADYGCDGLCAAKARGDPLPSQSDGRRPSIRSDRRGRGAPLARQRALPPRGNWWLERRGARAPRCRDRKS